MSVNAPLSTPSKLLDSDVWQARLFTGDWHAGSSQLDVIEPATGDRQVARPNRRGRCCANRAIGRECV